MCPKLKTRIQKIFYNIYQYNPKQRSFKHLKFELLQQKSLLHLIINLLNTLKQIYYVTQKSTRIFLKGSNKTTINLLSKMAIILLKIVLKYSKQCGQNKKKKISESKSNQ